MTADLSEDLYLLQGEAMADYSLQTTAASKLIFTFLYLQYISFLFYIISISLNLDVTKLHYVMFCKENITLQFKFGVSEIFFLRSQDFYSARMH